MLVAKLDRKRWNALGKHVELALTEMERDPHINQQASMLAEVLLKAVQGKLANLGGSERPAAAFIFAGLHIMHSLADAAIPFDQQERSKRLAKVWDRLLQEPSQPDPNIKIPPVVPITRKRRPKRLPPDAHP